MSKVLTKFEINPFTGLAPRWICQEEGCFHSTSFMTMAILHQNQIHYLPMREVKLNEDGTQLTWEKEE